MPFLLNPRQNAGVLLQWSFSCAHAFQHRVSLFGCPCQCHGAPLHGIENINLMCLEDADLIVVGIGMHSHSFSRNACRPMYFNFFLNAGYAWFFNLINLIAVGYWFIGRWRNLWHLHFYGGIYLYWLVLSLYMFVLFFYFLYTFLRYTFPQMYNIMFAHEKHHDKASNMLYNTHCCRSALGLLVFELLDWNRLGDFKVTSTAEHLPYLYSTKNVRTSRLLQKILQFKSDTIVVSLLL